jgi:hypothetical protein
LAKCIIIVKRLNYEYTLVKHSLESLFPRFSKVRVLVQFDHFLNNLVGASIKRHFFTLFLLSWVVTALLYDPLFFTDVKLSCELAIVFADNALDWVVETVSDVVCALWNFLRFSAGVVGNQSLAIWAQIVCGNFSVKATILERRVVPVFVFKFEFVEEIVSAR